MGRGKYPSYPMLESAVVVADSELPDSLRGRFQRVFIQHYQNTHDEQVFFALNEQMHKGIICDSRPYVSDFGERSIGESVHAYYYQRQ
jgi:hypothetical protein